MERELINYLIIVHNLHKKGIKELYLYLIADVDDKFREQLTIQHDFKKIFSQDGEVYQHSYPEYNAYIQVVSPKAIIC